MTIGSPTELSFHPLAPARWPDLEELFGVRGACGGCWCMTWRLARSDFDAGKGGGNKAALAELVAAGAEPGILGYDHQRAIGWCAVAPRSSYPVLDRSRILKPVDDQPVWSISCLFVQKTYRRRGVTTRLIESAVEFAAERGATIVEGYPVEPRNAEMPPVFAWTGIASAFRRAGFVEVARRSETRPIVRKYID